MDKKFYGVFNNGSGLTRWKLRNGVVKKKNLETNNFKSGWIDRNFSYVKKYKKDTFKHQGDDTGKSIVTDVTYKFRDGYIVILCYDYSKEHGGQDHLSVSIDTTELNKWFVNDAWK